LILAVSAYILYDINGGTGSWTALTVVPIDIGILNLGNLGHQTFDGTAGTRRVSRLCLIWDAISLIRGCFGEEPLDSSHTDNSACLIGSGAHSIRSLFRHTDVISSPAV
jgi:hypothetical protein